MSSSRDKILNTVKANQPEQRALPEIGAGPVAEDLTGRFISVLESIGGTAYVVSGYERIKTILRETHPDVGRVIEGVGRFEDPHALEDVGLAILEAHFGVAENGACWITEDRMGERVLPFIAQHLALVIRRDSLVPNMHAAYERIAGIGEYGFATFIAGPSKTADIEQSLVLGAHGPKSLIVFLVDEGISDAGYF
ncbi:MAG: LUD domain-containing protein [Bacteroidetes bacterium]|nr:LUD domain-containing protein [Bacteroidota bacterium]